MKINWTKVQQSAVIGFFVLTIIFLCLQIKAQLEWNRMEREARENHERAMRFLEEKR